MPPGSSDAAADGLLAGAIDTHVHTAPDLVERYQTDLALARDALAAGMDGVVVKSHSVPTVGRVAQVNEAVGETVLYGGVALNGTVGGLNLDAVETALGLGAAIVWLPTAWSANHARQARAAGTDRFVGQRVPSADEELRVADGGEVTPRTRRIVELVAEHDAVLATGHVDPDSIEAVVDACAEAGTRVLVNHPFSRLVDLSIEEQSRLASRGAVLEYCALAIESTEDHSIDRVATAIDRIGAEHCVLATDYGQAENPPVPGLRRFAEDLVAAGTSRSTVRRALVDTPADLLDR